MGCKTLFWGFLLCLVLATTAFPGQAGADNRAIFSGASGVHIHVLEFNIDTSGRWNQLREITISACAPHDFLDCLRGPVGFTAMTAPDSKERLNVYYTFNIQHEAPHLAEIRFDLEKFEVISHKSLHKAKFRRGEFFVGAYSITTNPNKQRIGFLNHQKSIVTRKIKSSGELDAKQSTVFGHDVGLDFITGGFQRDGGVAAQIQFDSASEREVIDFQNFNGRGKNLGKSIRFELEGTAPPFGGTYDLSLSQRFGDRYYAAFRDFKAPDKTRVRLTPMEFGTNLPLGNAIQFKGFKSSPFLYELGSGALYVYQNFLVYGQNDPKCDKVTVRVRQFDVVTGDPVGKEQTIIGCNSAALQNGNGAEVHGYSAVGVP